MKNKFLMIFGTRPEMIKLYPVMKYLSDFKILFTGQHKETLDFLGIRPDYHLTVMQKDQTLNELSSKLFLGIDSLLSNIKPEYVIVQGDTTTAYIASVCAFNRGIKIIHIEAGLRTYDMKNPYPEEFNRVSIDLISDILFAPSPFIANTLGYCNGRIYVSGNTIVDACLEFCDFNSKNSYTIKDYILVTLHRRENFGLYVKSVVSEIRNFSEKFNVNFLIIEHPNKIFEKSECSHLFNDRMKLIKSIGYVDFLDLLRHSKFVMTDSGGVQEEASILNKISLCMRKRTERIELISNGYSILVGDDMEWFNGCMEGFSFYSNNLNKKIQEHPYYIEGGSGSYICNILKGL